MLIQRDWFFGIIYLFLLILSGCTSTQTQNDSLTALHAETDEPTETTIKADGKNLIPATLGLPPDPGEDKTYYIGPHDLLTIEVFQVDELSSKERVSQDGHIVLPLIGAIKVVGLTPSGLEMRIANLLREKYLQDPQVNVYVEEYAHQKVTVMGAVNSPGVFDLQGETTLLEAVAQAGGVDDEIANAENVVVFRPDTAGKLQAYVVNLEQVQKGELADPILIGDDKVVVPKSGTAVFFKGLTDTLRGFVTFTPLIY